MAVNTYSDVAVVVAVVVALLNKGFKWEKKLPRRKKRTWVSKFRLTAVGVGAGLDLW